MKKFIRLDRVGEWRGTEHRSSFQGRADDDEFGSQWEDGISCYCLEDYGIGEAIDHLRRYWMDVAMLNELDYANMQVTVFEGMKLDGMGFDSEDMAVCTKTLVEAAAQPFMSKVYELYDFYYEEEISEIEYEQALSDLYIKLLNN